MSELKGTQLNACVEPETLVRRLLDLYARDMATEGALRRLRHRLTRPVVGSSTATGGSCASSSDLDPERHTRVGGVDS